MSCNGCRVLRKGCREDCMLRQCLQWTENPQAQANATLFVAKFFGRAGLMSFISAVPPNQRPALFQSLLFEACGRTVNPVSGAVGLLWTGNWHVCQAAVETVLSGGVLKPMPEFCGRERSPESDDSFEGEVDFFRPRDSTELRSKLGNRKIFDDVASFQGSDLDLCLTTGLTEKRRPATPSEESETTTFESSANRSLGEGERKMLRLFI
ncbi:hypothetical protein L1049_015076 [Liquidambar formosana]|uniref:LOB domain-containing protein n=1 Tax=Liquidambar formosana TaxID=63359 RepID=A0AAP0X689_LIQFO